MFSFHIARHSLARFAVERMSVYLIAMALAHSDIKTTQIYLDSFNEKLPDKVLDSSFEGY